MELIGGAERREIVIAEPDPGWPRRFEAERARIASALGPVRTPALDVHVHVWAEGSGDVERHLAFRDRLRECARDRAAYEALERDLARHGWDDMNAYADAKGALIREILAGRAGP